MLTRFTKVSHNMVRSAWAGAPAYTIAALLSFGCGDEDPHSGVTRDHEIGVDDPTVGDPANREDVPSGDRDNSPSDVRSFVPPIAPAEFSADLQWVEMDTSESAISMTAYNADGDVIGRVAFAEDPAAPGIYHATSEYADGYSVAVVDVMNEVLVSTESTLSDSELADRAELMADMIVPMGWSDPQEFQPALECGLGVAVAIANCLPSTVLVILRCPLSSSAATCKCIKAHSKGKSECKKKKK